MCVLPLLSEVAQRQEAPNQTDLREKETVCMWMLAVACI